MYFPLKDQNDIFRIGVAVSDKPYGPFVPEANPMKGRQSKHALPKEYHQI